MKVVSWSAVELDAHYLYLLLCGDIGPKTNTKLVMAGMAFVQWIARMVSHFLLSVLVF